MITALTTGHFNVPSNDLPNANDPRSIPTEFISIRSVTMDVGEFPNVDANASNHFNVEAMAQALVVLSKQITPDSPVGPDITPGEPQITRAELPQLIAQIPPIYSADVINALSDEELTGILLALEQGGADRLPPEPRARALSKLMPLPHYDIGPDMRPSERVYNAAYALSVEYARQAAQQSHAHLALFSQRELGRASQFPIGDADLEILRTLKDRNAADHTHTPPIVRFRSNQVTNASDF